jgi:hypothetical protein
MSEKVVATEVAEADFARWVSAMDLVDKLDPSQLDDEDKKSLAAAKTTLIQAMESGRLVVDEKGQFVFTPAVGQGPITFYEPSGATLIAMDGKKDGHSNAKMFAAMADFTKTPSATLAALKMRDLRVCQAITVLFLG